MSEPLLPPPAASRLLRDEFGVSRTPATLAKQRVTGGGPPFRKLNRAVLYAPADLRAWANAALEIIRRSTSDRGSPCSTSHGPGSAQSHSRANPAGAAVTK